MGNIKIVKNYIYNTIYQILILIAPLVTTPYVARVLSVTNIGVYQYAEAIVNYFVLVGAVGTTLYGQREIAYLQEKPKERSTAFWEIELFRLATTLICTAVFYVVFCVRGTYSEVFTILTLEVLAVAFDISWLYMGMENFKLIVIRNTIIKVTGVISVFLFVKKPSDLGIYTLCVTAPLFLGNISLWFSLKKYIVATGSTILELARGIRRRIEPILILFLPQIAMDVYLLLDKTMIGIFGSSIDQVGYYSQGQKIIMVFVKIVSSLGTVMLPAMSAFFSKGDIDGIMISIKRAFRFTYMLSFALLFGVCAIARRFVPLFFGEGYEPVIPLMIIISPIIVIIGTSNVIGRQFLLPTNQNKAFTASIFAGAVVNFTLNTILIHFWDAVGASISTVIAELVVTGVQCWFIKGMIPFKDILRLALRYCLFGFVMFAVCKTFDYLLPIDRIWVVIVIVFMGIFVYSSELLLTKDPIVNTIQKLLLQKAA